MTAVYPGTREAPELAVGQTAERRTTEVTLQTAPVRPTPRRSAAWIATVSVASAAAIAAVWFLLYAAVLSGFQEHGSQSRLYAQFRSELANETGPVGAPIPPGQPVALISVPEAGLGRAVVVEGSTSRQLEAGPGHQPDTPLPGQMGDSEILGRALAFGGPFSRITSLRAGDSISVTTAQGGFVYRVEDVRYAGAPGPRSLDAGQSRLTLVTATSGWLGPLAPDKAVYVDALLSKGAAQPVPSPLPPLGGSSRPMAGNSEALVPLIFWLEGLLVVSIAVAFAWRRWGRWQTWMAGVPLLIGAAWGTSAYLIEFLPNLL